LQDFFQIIPYHHLHWNNVWGALMM